MSAFRAAVDHAAVDEPRGRFAPVFAHEGLPKLELDHQVRRR
ncbi:MAG: hypothetical protein ACLP22_00625 [Solirubrobacteraceae bacterium]